MRPMQRGREHFEQSRAQVGGQRLGIGPRIGARGAHDDLSPDIGGEKDQRVLEVDAPPRAVLHHALVEHLEEDLMHVGMGLLDLVEQNDAVGAPPHRLRQAPALAIADIAGRARL